MLAALGRFDKREFSLILALIVFAVMALLFTYLVLPKAKIFREVSTTEATLKKVVESGDLLDIQLAQLQDDIDLLQHRLHGDMASLPEKEIEAYVVGKLQRMSWQNNVQLVGIEPSDGATIESFHEILFRVSLAGDYFDMYQWLREVSNELGFVLIKQYEMKPLDGLSQQPRLSVTLTMATYRAMQ
jgi:Tfp pilus assembly protein PilO